MNYLLFALSYSLGATGLLHRQWLINDRRITHIYPLKEIAPLFTANNFDIIQENMRFDDEEYDSDDDEDEEYEEGELDEINLLDDSKSSSVPQDTRDKVEKKIMEIATNKSLTVKQIKWVGDRLELTVDSESAIFDPAVPPISPSVDELDALHRDIYNAIEIDSKLSSLLENCEACSFIEHTNICKY